MLIGPRTDVSEATKAEQIVGFLGADGSLVLCLGTIMIMVSTGPRKSL